MKLFISSLQGESKPPPVEISFTNPVISISEVGEYSPPVLEENPITYRDLVDDEVRLLIMAGHSDMNGQGWTEYRADGNYADPSELLSNDTLKWNPNTQTFEIATWSSPARHGRDLQIHNWYKSYFDASHTEPLHFIKDYRSGHNTDQFVIGSPFFNSYWNDHVVPSINQLITSGKTVVVNILIDLLTGSLRTVTYGVHFYSWDYLLYSFKYMFNKYNLAMDMTGVNPDYMPNGWLFDAYMKQFELESEPFVNYISKEGLLTNGSGDVHAGHFDFDSIATQHLQSIQNQPVFTITNLLTPIEDASVIYFKYRDDQKGIINIKADVPFNAICFNKEPIAEFTNETDVNIDIRLYRYGYFSILNPMTGVTRLEVPYIGLASYFDFIEKYNTTLNYIDIRGNSLTSYVTDTNKYTPDEIIKNIVDGGVTNGILLMEDGTPLTAASTVNYQILIDRGWTIDVAPFNTPPAQGTILDVVEQ